MRLDFIHLSKIAGYATKLNNVLFIVSYQESEPLDSVPELNNIILVSPDKQMSRTEHWTFILTKIKLYECHTFSFLFYGDELECGIFADMVLPRYGMVYSNSYLICKEGVLSFKRNIIILSDERKNINLLMNLGLATVAPLQKFLFKKECAERISFPEGNPYFSDQEAIMSLLSHKEILVRYIDSPFYIFNLNQRNMENNINLIAKLKMAGNFFKKYNFNLGFLLYAILQLVKSVTR